MKKLAIIAILALLISVPVFAQTTSTSKVITATISANLTITGGFGSGAQTIPAAGGVSSLGDITIQSNMATAWTVTVSSTKAGRMKADGITENIPYTVIFRPAGSGTTPIINELALGDGTTATNRSASVTTGVATVVYTLEVKNSAFSSSLPAGTYTDTITVTISGS